MKPEILSWLAQLDPRDIAEVHITPDRGVEVVVTYDIRAEQAWASHNQLGDTDLTVYYDHWRSPMYLYATTRRASP